MIGAEPFGWRWQRHSVLTSTQDVAMAAARAGDPGRLAITAERQSAGRGSRGRRWLSPQGNLNLSVLLCSHDAGSEPARWALMAGVALYDALSRNAEGLVLKWPNDVLLADGKLAGVLVDSQWGADGCVAWVVIGMGANLAVAPDVPGRAVACLGADAPQASDVAALAVERLEFWSGRSTSVVCAAWLERAHPLGTLLDVQMPKRRVCGAFAGLTATGELLVEGEAGPISSADVFVQPAMVSTHRSECSTGGLGAGAAGAAYRPQAG